MTDLYQRLEDGTFVPVGFEPGEGFVGSDELRTPKMRPAAAPPLATRLQSADLVHRICEHELAEGMAVVNGVDINTKAVPEGYGDIAHRVLAYIAEVPSCPLKGSR